MLTSGNKSNASVLLVIWTVSQPFRKFNATRDSFSRKKCNASSSSFVFLSVFFRLYGEDLKLDLKCGVKQKMFDYHDHYLYERYSKNRNELKMAWNWIRGFIFQFCLWSIHICNDLDKLCVYQCFTSPPGPDHGCWQDAGSENYMDSTPATMHIWLVQTFLLSLFFSQNPILEFRSITRSQPPNPIAGSK